MPKKKLAIFDMDGTLVDTKDVNFYAYKEALEEEGFSLSYEYYCKFCNGRHYTVFLKRSLSSNPFPAYLS